MQILDIVESAGGLQGFNDAMTSFMSNFYTDAEQVAFITQSMEASFSTLGVTMPQTKDAFRDLLETMDTSTEEGAYLYGQVLLLSEGFAQMSTATEQLSQSVSASVQNIADAWLGNLSYLTLKQKADFASGYLALGLSGDGTIDTVAAARLAAETALKTTSTKEEYIPVFERYIAELEGQEADATNNDIVDRLDELINRVIDLEETTRKVG
jgi:phage-related protein